MINAQRTGAYISQLRKAKDWTQLELAERLHVTHQAVSQWEKGVAFPDVTLLPSLARLLGITVDDLLNGEPLAAAGRTSRGAIVEELASGNPGEAAQLVKRDPEGIDAMLAAAPLARPSQMDEIVSHLGGLHFTLQQLVDLAPFVSSAALQSALSQVAPDQIDADAAADLAPFLDHDTLDRWAPRLAEGLHSFEALEGLAPFLRRETLAGLVLRLVRAGRPLQPEHVAMLAPFLNQEGLDLLLERLPAGAVSIDLLVELAPFARRAALDRLIAQLDDPAQLADHIEDLAPFIGPAALKQALANFGGGLTSEVLLACAPFLGREGLDELLRSGSSHATVEAGRA